MPIASGGAAIYQRRPPRIAFSHRESAAIRKFLAKLRALALSGKRYHCTLCARGYRRFLTVGDPPRPNAMCPGCASLERHRLLWLALQERWRDGTLANTGRLLHVAPEPVLADIFKRQFEKYVSIDLDGAQAMHAMDITDLSFADGSFDAIVCNHVLEHVPNDRVAIAELFRVLKPGGWGSIQVPMAGAVTQEDLSITDPEERHRLYGQEDHVRMYGSDYTDRLREAGFEVMVLPKQDLLNADGLARIAVDCENEVVLVSKPRTS